MHMYGVVFVVWGVVVLFGGGGVLCVSLFILFISYIILLH